MSQYGDLERLKGRIGPELAKLRADQRQAGHRCVHCCLHGGSGGSAQEASASCWVQVYMCEHPVAVRLKDRLPPGPELCCSARTSSRLGTCVKVKSLETLDTMHWLHCSLRTGVHLQSA